MSYLPRSDSGLLDWSTNLQTKLVELADPTTVGLSTQTVTKYTAALSDYAEKYAAAVAPETKGTATVLAKNVSKAALEALSRSLAMTITNFQGVTDAQRQAFGLTVKDRAPTRHGPPRTAPELSIRSVIGRTINIRLRDAENPGRRGKPDRVAGAAIMMYIGEDPPASIREWTFYTNASRTLLSVQVDSAVPNGSRVYLSAFWFNRKSQAGPACAPQDAYVTNGSMSTTKAA